MKQEPKQLDRHAATIGEHLRAKGYNLDQIREEFAKQGYLTRNRTEYDVTSISKFLVSQGATRKGRGRAKTMRSPPIGARPLDQAAFTNIIKPLREAGHSIKQITKRLKSEGYTTKTGKILCNSTVSHFLIQNGMRTYQKKTKKASARHLPRVHTKVEEADKTSDMELASRVLNSTTLSKSKKLKLLEALLE